MNRRLSVTVVVCVEFPLAAKHLHTHAHSNHTLETLNPYIQQNRFENHSACAGLSAWVNDGTKVIRRIWESSTTQFTRTKSLAATIQHHFSVLFAFITLSVSGMETMRARTSSEQSIYPFGAKTEQIFAERVNFAKQKGKTNICAIGEQLIFRRQCEHVDDACMRAMGPNTAHVQNEIHGFSHVHNLCAVSCSNVNRARKMLLLQLRALDKATCFQWQTKWFVRVWCWATMKRHFHINSPIHRCAVEYG